MEKIVKKIVVEQTPENEIPVEVLAGEISAIAAGMKKLRSGRLNDTALCLLIQHAAPSPKKYGSPLSIRAIKAVLDGIASLEATYLKKPAP